jgi:2-dehydropantoate 2-reductase
MKIAIVGAGAIGCYIGGRLAAVGADVVFVARSRMRDELMVSGMTLIDLEARKTSPRKLPPSALCVEVSPLSLADCDVVLVCVKSAQTEETARELSRVLPTTALVVSMQNGVRNADVLRSELHGIHVLNGIVGFNVVAEEKGIFRRTTSGLLVLEASQDVRVVSLKRALIDAGFDTEIAEDIRGKQWSKLVMNLNNALGALTDISTVDLLFDAQHRRNLEAVMAEALEVLRHANIRTARLGALPVTLFPWMLRLPTGVLRVVARVQVTVDPEARSSMWQDLVRRRLTEVDFLNGEIVRLAEAYRVKAPMNEKIVALIHAAEREGKGSPKMSADALWRALHS